MTGWSDQEGALRGLDFDIDASGRRRIHIPVRANIAVDTVGRHAGTRDGGRLAVRFDDGVAFEDITYDALQDASCRLAGYLRDAGVGQGDVVAVHSGSRIETVIAHLAIYRIGAIAATLSQLYGPDTVRHILRDSGARLLVTQDRAWRPISAVRLDCPDLADVVVVGEADEGECGFAAALEHSADPQSPVDTAADDPALLIYTSGSTGRPKGVLHAHRILHGYKPTLELFFDLTLREPDLVLWTAADWAWVGGLIDVVYPALMFGQRLIASQHRFEPEWALDFMARHGVTHCLLTPTALNRMAQIAAPRRGRDLRLRLIFTGGEPLPARTVRWLEEELGVVCNEGYGMSEVNHMIGNCRRLRPIKPGSMGWEFPGHVVALVDEAGRPVPDGEVGEIVTTPDAPTLFLGYWGRPDLTAGARLGPWVRTHDLARRDADGYYWYCGRSDDLIKSAGYRIGPTEIEETLTQHPAVAEAAVIGVPDAERGQLVKAFVRLASGGIGNDGMIATLQQHVRQHLGPYKIPRLVEFLAELPTTSTGKLSRVALRLHANSERQSVTPGGKDEP